jgi:methyl-accepting chemotaxis protein
MRFLNLGLRSRLYLGFAVLVAFGLGVAGFGMLGLSSVTGSVSSMDSISGNLVRMQTVASNLEVIRRAASRYRLDADQGSLTTIGQAETGTAGLLVEATNAAPTEVSKNLYNGIGETLRATTAESEAFVRAYQAGFAARAKLFTGGDELTTATARLVAAASQAGTNPELSTAAGHVESAMLLVRVANWRFLATLDPKGPATFRTSQEKAAAALTALEHLATDAVKPLIPPVRDALTAYATNFALASNALIEGADHMDKEVRPHLEAMQKATATALALLRQKYAGNAAESLAGADRTMWLQAIVAGVAAVIGVLMAFLIGRGIVRPISSMTIAMTRLASGDSDVDVPARENTDEIGAMARAVEVFKQNAIENRRLTAASAKEQAARDRRQAAMDTHTQDFGTSVSGVMASLGQSAGKMQTAANEMSEAAKRTRTSSSGAVEGANASARDLNSVAVAAEQMAASISEISRQVTHVTTAVGKAVDRAAETDKKVAGLSDTADRIGDVVRLITDIAGQTNLLALNATIEAARAGEAGKGFAVVASEVKTLATQTARATDQIGAQIVAIRTSTGEAVDAVRDVGLAIGQVASVATAIAAAVEQQAAATREISASVQNVTHATNNAAQAMEQVLTIAEQTDAASHSVLTAADEVGKTADTLQVEVNDFLSAMRRGDGEERRTFERMPGGGITASLTLPGAGEIEVVVKNISRGGVALVCNRTGQAGTEVKVGLPTGANVSGRIARSEGGLLTVAFRQDAATMALVDRALEAIKSRTQAVAA